MQISTMAEQNMNDLSLAEGEVEKNENEHEREQQQQQEEEKKEKERVIMVAVEESDESMKALKWTLRNLPATRLIIIHCEGYLALADQVSLTPHVVQVLEKRMRLISERVLSAAKTLCQEANVEAETMRVRGDARYAICDAAESHAVDLLVVGSRGHGAIRRAVIGSVSNFCAHHAKCPVLIVKGQE